MRVRVRMNQLALATMSRAVSTALEETAEAIKTEVVNADVMPFDTGTMQNESTFIDDSKSDIGQVSIVVDTPYAQKLYYHPEYNFRTDKNPNAQGRWFDPWIDGDKKDFAGRAFKELYRRNTRGVVD